MTSSATNNYILEYWEEIRSGRTLVSDKVRKAYASLVDSIENPKAPYIFDVK